MQHELRGRGTPVPVTWAAALVDATMRFSNTWNSTCSWRGQETHPAHQNGQNHRPEPSARTERKKSPNLKNKNNFPRNLATYSWVRSSIWSSTLRCSDDVQTRRCLQKLRGTGSRPLTCGTVQETCNFNLFWHTRGKCTEYYTKQTTRTRTQHHSHRLETEHF